MNKKEILMISIGVFLTVIAWLIADVYHAATQEKMKVKIELPASAKYEIDLKILDTLQNKKE